MNSKYPQLVNNDRFGFTDCRQLYPHIRFIFGIVFTGTYPVTRQVTNLTVLFYPVASMVVNL